MLGQDALRITSRTRAYTYKVTVQPATTPVTLDEVKAQLNIDPLFTDDDVLLNQYILASTKYAENLMRRDIIVRTYETYRDFFPGGITYYGYYSPYSFQSGNVGFEVRRSPLQAVTSIDYLVDGVFTSVDPSKYYNTVQNDYSVVLTKKDNLWPSNADEQLQSIKITFTCGMASDATGVPSDIKIAIMQLVTSLYENRGDCSDSGCQSFIPDAARSILLQNRINNL